MVLLVMVSDGNYIVNIIEIILMPVVFIVNKLKQVYVFGNISLFSIFISMIILGLVTRLLILPYVMNYNVEEKNKKEKRTK